MRSARSPRSWRAWFGGLACGLAAIVGTGSTLAYSQQPQQQPGLIDPSQIPSVHNTLYKVPEGAVGWDLLGDLVI